MAQQIVDTTRQAQRTAGAIINANFSELYRRNAIIELLGVTSGGTFVVPAGHAIEHIYVSGNNSNTVNGGIKIGTTSGATDVVSAQPVPGNSVGFVPGSNIVARVFNKTAAQTLYFDAVTGWASANVDIKVIARKVW